MKRVVTIVAVVAAAAVLGVVLTVNGIRSAQTDDRLRACEVQHPIGTAAYDRCAAAVRG